MTQINGSGIQPVEYKVRILPDDTEKVTTGGIHIPEQLHERHEWAQVKGTLVAKGGNAFEDWNDEPEMEIGASVYFAKYQGILIPGNDGNEYRLCNDKDIGALVT